MSAHSGLGYVRAQYGVPAHRGRRVTFQGRPGRILSSTHARLNVLLDSGERIHIHPTWEVVYEETTP